MAPWIACLIGCSPVLFLFFIILAILNCFLSSWPRSYESTLRVFYLILIYVPSWGGKIIFNKLNRLLTYLIHYIWYQLKLLLGKQGYVCHLISWISAWEVVANKEGRLIYSDFSHGIVTTHGRTHFGTWGEFEPMMFNSKRI